MSRPLSHTELKFLEIIRACEGKMVLVEAIEKEILEDPNKTNYYACGHLVRRINRFKKKATPDDDPYGLYGYEIQNVKKSGIPVIGYIWKKEGEPNLEFSKKPAAKQELPRDEEANIGGWFDIITDGRSKLTVIAHAGVELTKEETAFLKALTEGKGEKVPLDHFKQNSCVLGNTLKSLLQKLGQYNKDWADIIDPPYMSYSGYRLKLAPEPGPKPAGTTVKIKAAGLLPS